MFPVLSRYLSSSVTVKTCALMSTHDTGETNNEEGFSQMYRDSTSSRDSTSTHTQEAHTFLKTAHILFISVFDLIRASMRLPPLGADLSTLPHLSPSSPHGLIFSEL